MNLSRVYFRRSSMILFMAAILVVLGAARCTLAGGLGRSYSAGQSRH